MPISKPRVFIGSAGESKTIAHKIFAGIDDFAEAVVWTRAFRPGDYTLEAILDKLALSDFGVFVFTPDDVADIKKRRFKVIRDNVIFELGLFIGRLGRKRCIAVVPHGVDKLHLPTDLLGLTFATYLTNRSDKDLHQALVPVCEAIRDAVEMHGKFKPTEEDASRRLVEKFEAWLTTEVTKPVEAGEFRKSAARTLAVKKLKTESVQLIGAKSTKKFKTSTD
jgi:hypothetical protein